MRTLRPREVTWLAQGSTVSVRAQDQSRTFDAWSSVLSTLQGLRPQESSLARSVHASASLAQGILYDEADRIPVSLVTPKAGMGGKFSSGLVLKGTLQQ